MHEAAIYPKLTGLCQCTQISDKKSTKFSKFEIAGGLLSVGRSYEPELRRDARNIPHLLG
jgi:hypothetical protein